MTDKLRIAKVATGNTVWHNPELYMNSDWVVGAAGYDEQARPAVWDGPASSIYAVDTDGSLMWVADTLSPEMAAAIVEGRAAAMNEADLIASQGI